MFGYNEAAVARAKLVLETFDAAVLEGKGVAMLDGKLIENLHAAEARRLVAFAEAIEHLSVS